MRVLVVSAVSPQPEGIAAARCLLALIGGLEAHDVGVQVLCPALAGVEVEPPPPGVAVEYVAMPSRGRWSVRWNRLRAPLGEMAREPFASRLRERSREVDLLHLAESEPAAAIGCSLRPTVVQLHCLTRRDSRVWNPLRPQGRTSIELLRAERRARRRARWMLVNSQEVAAPVIAGSPRAEVIVAPLALDPAHYEPAAGLQAPLAGLIGNARWPPTANAVERLLSRVWPLVVEQRPQASLLLAGDGMEREAFAHLPSPPGVQWLGRVPSAADFLRELGVLLYPLSAGSGAKVKVLEAMALGLPIVTTADGAEGIFGRGGIVVEEDDRRLAAATIALLDDLDARRTAGAAARRSFQEHHAPAAAAAPVVDLYRRMLA